MALSDTYARVIRENAKDSHFVGKLISYMKAKGHVSLLPSVVRSLERHPEVPAATVLVANEKDVHTHTVSIQRTLSEMDVREKPTIVRDPNIVGGYVVHAGARVVDRSFRNALVSLYRKTVNH